ncbi:MAG TPA: hypothetical protein VNI01_15795 [Elusimicrobiota bacterium]|jgi:hypothetical protein|nr:hypothetical protein [Elusimicrobiota bacterium]
MNKPLILVAVVLALGDAAAFYVWWTYPKPVRAAPVAAPALPAAVPAPPSAAAAPAPNAAAAIVNTSKGPMSREDAIAMIAFAPPQAQRCIRETFGDDAVDRFRAGKIELSQDNVAKAEQCLDARAQEPGAAAAAPEQGAAPHIGAAPPSKNP